MLFQAARLAIGGASARDGEYGLMREQRRALILALQRNRGELDAGALERLLRALSDPSK
jgi:hypothetical protein